MLNNSYLSYSPVPLFACIDAANNPHHLCLISYRIPEGFTPTLSSHGNAKETKPFYPTWPSTLCRVKEESITKGPKATMECVSHEVGGVIGASAPGELPRNEKQVENMKRKLKCMNSSDRQSDGSADILFSVMQEAYTQDPSNKFVRDVKAAPDPAIVLAFDRQLHDIVRFCTSSFKFGVLTVDPTFSLGEFDATPITYRHLLLETRRSGCTPILLGPVLIHYRKDFSTYLYFASTLVGLNRQLQAVRAFGTDGEQALIDAFAHELTYSQHLTCFIHVRRNIKDKLSSCGIPTGESNKIMDEIFGHQVGHVFVEGLIDVSNDAEFQEKLDLCVQAWQELALPSSANMSCFVEWFLKSKAGVIRNTMLRSTREECGLGNPPQAFTTNASESINALLKHKVDYQRKELPVFAGKVKELINEQEKEIERAIIDRGKYRLRSQYRYLQIEESKWFTMTAQQRSSHLHKVHSTTVSNVEKAEAGGRGTACISIDVEAAAKELNLPLTCIEGIWRKAGELIQKQNAIVAAPGQSLEARMVLSYTGKVPHMVIPTKAGGYSCDQSCPNWKSLGLCSHTVAVAELHGKLASLVSCVQKKKKMPNITQLTTATMPRGRGRKGGVAPRSRNQVPRASCQSFKHSQSLRQLQHRYHDIRRQCSSGCWCCCNTGWKGSSV